MKKRIGLLLALLGVVPVGAQEPMGAGDETVVEEVWFIDEEQGSEADDQDGVEFWGSSAPHAATPAVESVKAPSMHDRIAQKSQEGREKKKLDKELARQERRERKVQHQDACKKRKQDRCICNDAIRACRVKCDQERCVLIQQWQDICFQRERKDEANGRFADLYKSPAWPTYMQFVEDCGFFNFTVDYRYATDAYGNSGSGTGDITKLAFGEAPIRLRDMLLASSLMVDGQERVLALDKAGGANNTSYYILEYLAYHAGRQIKFWGQESRYEFDLDFARYFANQSVLVGVQVPVVYNRHRLRADVDIAPKAVDPIIENAATPQREEINAVGTMGAMSQRLDNIEFTIQPLLMRKILSQKGLAQSTNASSLGLGDISFYANVQLHSPFVERAVLGVRAKIPTAKKNTGNKLWEAPLGDGYARFDGFAAAMIGYNRVLNPHFMFQVTACMPYHRNERVPKRVQIDFKRADADAGGNQKLESKEFAFANYLALRPKTEADPMAMPPVLASSGKIDDYDTAVRGFGDKVTSVKIRPGSQVQLRVGNLFQCMFSRRGTLDVFYDFRAKEAEKVSAGLDRRVYDIATITNNTYQLEHRFGGEYCYQFDHDARLRLAALYTVAGQNVPKTIQVMVQFTHAF